MPIRSDHRALLAAVVLALTVPWPGPARSAALAGAALAGFWLAASLAATWFAYDRSGLYRWWWLTDLLPAPPARYAVVSAGLYEVSATLRRRFPDAEPVLVDLCDPALTPEGSIQPSPRPRAGAVRRSCGPSRPATGGDRLTRRGPPRLRRA